MFCIEVGTNEEIANSKDNPIERFEILSYSSSTTAVVPLLTHEKAGVSSEANISN